MCRHKPTPQAAGRLATCITLALPMLMSCSNPPNEEQPSDPKQFNLQSVDGRYQNPPGSPSFSMTWRNGLSFWWRMITANRDERSPRIPDDHVVPETKAVAMLQSLQRANTLTWLGHA